MSKAPWESQMCPLLTIGLLKPSMAKESGLVVTQGGGRAEFPAKMAAPEHEAFPCHGPGCAWFQTIADENGNVVNGRCAVPLLAVGLSNVGAQVDFLRRSLTPEHSATNKPH